MATSQRYRATAPVRLDLAGGWTDVAPFATKEGGLVINAAIELRARVEFVTAEEGLAVSCRDAGASSRWEHGAWNPANTETLAFQQAAVRFAGIDAGQITTSSDVPRGSGLGGSGALGVALLAAFDAARGTSRAPAALAEAAFDFEAGEAAIPGGRQDQYAAALGGFNQLVCSAEGVQVRRLELDTTFLGVLLDHMVVCYTGVSRVSGSTITRVMGAYSQGDQQVTGALHALVEVADEMSQALRSADLARVGNALTRNWIHQQALDSRMQTSAMAALEKAIVPAGLMGAKAAGAGAGGSMIFLVRDRQAATMAARACGADILPFTWAAHGVLTEQE